MSQGLSYEESNFPIVCDKCLGETKFLRMIKSNQEKSCKICNRPCTVFRWKVINKKKYNQTTICYSCGKIRNVCQSCVCDMNYGIPLYKREDYIKTKIEKGDEKALELVNIPDSTYNRDYFMENKLNGNDDNFNKKIQDSDQIRKEILKEIIKNVKSDSNLDNKNKLNNKTIKNIKKN